ncbi:MAG: DUF2924 domain-containing protein [Rhodoplanes sp.]
MLARVVALKRMPVNDLKAEWKALFGTEAPNNSRSFLELRLAHRIQDLTYGGVARETAKLLHGLAGEAQGKPGRKSMITDSRNPVVGTRLLREWDGIEHTVTVMKDGFDWQGQKFKSLSAVARTITGTQWNGYRFFGLREGRRGQQ